jgi:glutamate-5-semialdehyde dehydrogenase
LFLLCSKSFWLAFKIPLRFLLLGQNARIAAKILRSASTQQKNNALNNIATQVDKNRKGILNANQKDLEQSKNNGLDTALLDRLMLNDARLDGIIESLSQIAALLQPSLFHRGE